MKPGAKRKNLALNIHHNAYDCTFYLAELRSSLPRMVVDILEEKMEQEYHVSAVSLLKHSNKTQPLSKTMSNDEDDGSSVVSTSLN